VVVRACLAKGIALKSIAELHQVLKKVVAVEYFEAETVAVAPMGFVQWVGDLISTRLLKHLSLCLASQSAHLPSNLTLCLAGTESTDLVGLDLMRIQVALAGKSAVKNCLSLVA
jgi:hypothetical protein